MKNTSDLGDGIIDATGIEGMDCFYYFQVAMRLSTF